MTKTQRKERAKNAAKTRWSKPRKVKADDKL
jgi:hypothetical protein